MVDVSGTTDISDDVIVGITSFGTEMCAVADVPGVYARVSGVYGWIEEQVCELASTIPDW